ncbi:MAG: hypothetical protein ABGZ24_20745, partial [Fuerstiella sp.]
FNGKNRILSHQLVGMPRFPKHAETHRILTEPRFLETHTFFNARNPCHLVHTFFRNPPRFGEVCLTEQNRRIC